MVSRNIPFMLCFCTCVSLFPSLLAPFVWWDPDSVQMSLPSGSPPYCHLWLLLLEMILSFNIHLKYIRLQSKRRRKVWYVCPVSPGVLGRTWSWGLTVFWSSLALSFWLSNFSPPATALLSPLAPPSTTHTDTVLKDLQSATDTGCPVQQIFIQWKRFCSSQEITSWNRMDSNLRWNIRCHDPKNSSKLS